MVLEMILLIIPIVLLIAYVVWFVYSRQFVDIGRVYVRMSANIIAIIDESEILEGKELSKLSNRKMVTDHFWEIKKFNFNFNIKKILK